MIINYEKFFIMVPNYDPSYDLEERVVADRPF
jgi:hypothetical protein